MEGIYRVPGRQSRLEALRESYDKGKPIEFEAKMEDPFTCADLMLLFLRTLPEQLIPQSVSPLFDAAVERPPGELDTLRDLIVQLPVHNRALLKLVCQHAARVVGAEAENKMGLKNVTIVFVPSMYCSPKVFASLVQNAESVFVCACKKCGNAVDIADPHLVAGQLLCPLCSAPPPDDVAAAASAADVAPEARKNRTTTLEKLVGKSPGGVRLSRNSKAAGGSPPPSPMPAANTPKKPLPGVPGVSLDASLSSPTTTMALTPSVSRSPRDGAVFGTELSLLCKIGEGGSSVLLPSVVRQCWKFVEKHANNAPSVYCAAPADLGQVDRLQALFDSGNKVALENELDGVADAVNVVASLFKRYVSMLPSSVFSNALLLQFENATRNSKPEARPLALSALVFQLPVELRAFLLHFISHLRIVIKHEMVSPERLMAEFAGCVKCSRDLLTAIYNNRRTILQPNCSCCQKLINLQDNPNFGNGEILCSQCASTTKH